MKTKHTPGPWRFNKNKTALLALNKENKYVFIYNASPYNSMEPSNKDAALIAAAPEMLAALMKIYTKLCSEQFQYLQNDFENELSNIEKTIQKARGD